MMDSPLLASPPPPESHLIPSLPDDVAILCIARVPRSHHPFLAAVSRAWRKLLRSPLLFSVRLGVGASQHFILINIRARRGQLHWYLFDRHPLNHSPHLIALPAPPFVSTTGFTPVALGHTLFLLGGNINGFPSSVVQIYDARFNCWRLGPPMLDSRVFAAAGVISGRIYIVGSQSTNNCWAEEFDLEKQRWRQILSPPKIRAKWRSGNAVIRGKLLAIAYHGGVGVVLDPALATTKAELMQEKAWSLMPTSLYLGWKGKAVVVGNILFSFSKLGEIKGYNFTTDEWRTVEGVDKELPKFSHGATLCNLGEVLCLVWEGRRKDKEFEVICAGVRVTETNTGGLHGSVEWFEKCFLAFQIGTSISDCISLEF